ncbi:MAG: trehalose-6-phosphate synthase [Candidatus Omnitrophica bacterium]|nr:trehalose-6-phosphate synthase [Candidatus Omnitrophota bacterium]
MFLHGKDRRLIVVSNRLPFSRYENENGEVKWEKASGGLITALEPILYDLDGIWLGWDGHSAEQSGEERSRLFSVKEIPQPSNVKLEEGKDYKIGCVPIKEDEVESYYNRFSNGTLWALFHYFFEKSHIDLSDWKTYCQVNERFAQYIDNIAREDDVIWIQDFHLMMTPFYLRQLRPRQEIHFFLHTPFPHTDILSILPWQDDLLGSLLCCDTVGFHHKQYLKNFLTAVDVLKRSREVPGEETAGDRGPLTYANPISIDFKLVDRTSREPAVIERKNEIRKKIASPKMILGVDRIDYSKGIRRRLRGIEHLIKTHPEVQGEFFYYQLVIPSREGVDAYKSLKKEIDELIGRINGKFATGLWMPIHYNYGTVPFAELVALYLAADIGLVTPLRDGMNLVCKEYIAAHSDNDGVLILSKFAGAVAEIKNCLAVNPYNVEEIGDAIYRALVMDETERKRRMKKMRKNIGSNDIGKWLEKCLNYFEQARGERKK